MSLQGNTSGIPKNIIAEMESWEEYQFPREYLIDESLALAMAVLSARLNRELAVYISRQGRVVYVAVGKDSTVPLAEMTSRRGRGLSGLRCIHTHPKGSGSLSSVDIAALQKLELDAMVALGINDEGEIISTGLAWGGSQNQNQVFVYPGLKELLEVDFTAMLKELNLREAQPMAAKEQEEAILVGLKRGNEDEAETSIEELGRLAESAGLKVVAKIIQSKSAPSASTYIGKGKAEEISLLAQSLDADVIIFDDEISPSAQLNLTRLIGRKIIDRTLLILDIFAQRARSNEGKLQVELAQLRYSLPRLMGQGLSLSRLGGGIGTRGPGETQLETDRRKIRSRIQELEAKQDQVLRTRNLHRQKRQKEELPMVALVGYTNAGKSTLLNALSGSHAHAEDILFATLDALTRRVELPGGQNILLTDTVGFIRRLPHHLVAAFRSTLEEVQEADLLLHVVDGSAKDAIPQAAAVLQVLGDLKALDKPMLTVINKGDKMPQGLMSLPGLEGEKVVISAKTGQGFDQLLAKLETHLPKNWHTVEFNLPFAKGGLLEELHSQGQVLSQEYTHEGILIKVKIQEKTLGRLKQEGLI